MQLSNKIISDKEQLETGIFSTNPSALPPRRQQYVSTLEDILPPLQHHLS